jgi:para-nitrobenzyl esterase
VGFLRRFVPCCGAVVAVAGAVLLCACGSSSAPAGSTGTTVVSTANGALQCATFAGHTDCLGIPYAEPPVAGLRFKAPAAPPSWSGTLDATQLRSACIQAKTAYVVAEYGAEDCLYLNAYIPAADAAASGLPVMVWFHGGGFMNGSGNAFNGAYLAQTANAIVVTVNYRLGPFGWLALSSLAAEAPDGTTGNYGLLDQIAALKWVQTNIRNLGGDPQRIAIVGQSAGGETVLAMLASSYAAGLFQRAISMSAPSSLSLPTVAQSEAKRSSFLAQLGCTDTTAQPACLRSASAQQLLDAANESWDLIAQLGLEWTPTIDGAVQKEQWVTAFREGNFNKVPVLIGHTKEEGGLFVATHDNAIGHAVTEDEVVASAKAFFGPAEPLVTLEYPASDYPTPGDQEAAVLTDAMFAAGETEDRDALSLHVPVYGYQTCDPNAPESHIHALYSTISCGHDSDLAYLFQWDDFSGEQPAFTANQWSLALQIGHYWGNFAASANPNGSGMVNWPQYISGVAPIQLLQPTDYGGISTTPTGSYLSDHKVTFWTALLALQSLVPTP